MAAEAPPAKKPRLGAAEEELASLAREAGGLDLFSEKFAELMDGRDELKGFRGDFHEPPAPTESAERCIYLCGNSLGLQPKNTAPFVQEELEKWQRWGVEGHFPSVNATRPWVTADEDCRNDMAAIVGAKPVEVAVMNSLTVNLHLLMCAFYRPTQERHKILMEGKAFPSDKFAIASQIRHCGFSPETSLLELFPREGERTLRTEDIEAEIAKHGGSLALVLFSGVQYYTGQFFELERISKKAREVGSNVGFDLAHAVGNVPLKLHDWGCDFACWCTYKYLNAGPGGIAGAFVHERHAKKGPEELPGRLAGWWGHRKEDRFEMEHHWVPSEGAQSFMLSNPPVLCIAALRASTDLFAKAGMERLRKKSLLLTGYLELLLRREIGEAHVEIITPADTAQRGCQLSLVFKRDMQEVHEGLAKRGVICDIRKPSVMRIAPAPLYNGFRDVHDFVALLKRLLLEGAAAAAAPAAAS